LGFKFSRSTDKTQLQIKISVIFKIHASKTCFPTRIELKQQLSANKKRSVIFWKFQQKKGWMEIKVGYKERRK
jgi:hypothetical protein